MLADNEVFKNDGEMSKWHEDQFEPLDKSLDYLNIKIKSNRNWL
jgi:hypothetical protein